MNQEAESSLLAMFVDHLETLCIQNAGMLYLLEHYWPKEETSWRLLLGEHRRNPRHAHDVTREFEPAKQAIPRDPLAPDLAQFVQLLLEALERIERKREM